MENFFKLQTHSSKVGCALSNTILRHKNPNAASTYNVAPLMEAAQLPCKFKQSFTYIVMCVDTQNWHDEGFLDNMGRTGQTSPLKGEV